MGRWHRRMIGFGLSLIVLASPVAFTSTETYTYDDLGRLVIVDHGDGKATTYALDPAGNRKTTNTSDGTPPTTPASLVATAVSPTQINLAWTASTDNVAVTEYRIERCAGAACANFSQVDTSATNSYSNPNLAEITAYRYRVRAGDAGGNLSAYSNTDDEVTLDGTGPSAPTNVMATVISATQVNLSWSASSDNVGVTEYRVERCAGVSCSNYAQIGTPATTSYSDTPVSQLTTYRYRVRAKDAANNFGGYSTTVNASTPDGTAPSTPTNFSATAVAYNQVNLTWTASTDNVGVVDYRVERCAGAGCSNFALSGIVTGPSQNDTPLAPSTSWSFRVRARDAADNYSAYSSTVSATTPAGPPAAPNISPTTLLNKTTGQSYSIAWGAVGGATTYQLYENGVQVWSGTTTSKSLTQFVDGMYYYEAKACNASGCSGFGAGRTVRVCAPGGCQ